MRPTILALLIVSAAIAQEPANLGARAERYLIDLIRLDTSNPPGNETRVAEYLKRVAAANGISAELLGAPARLNFVARIPAAVHSAELRPLLLIAHSDVVPVDRSQWSVPPFSAELRGGFIYGRGAQDDKSLLAAELAVMVELKRRGVKLTRDVILLSESDEEAGSTGINWLVRNAYSKIDAAFALNEGGAALDLHSGTRIFQIQTTEKVPTRVVLTAKGTAGHASLPRPDNPVVHLARAIAALASAAQPVQLNTTTRRYFSDLAKLPDYAWLAPLLSNLDQESTAVAAANKIEAVDPELNSMLRTSVTPTMLSAGIKVNVIPNQATAQVDVRRLPAETRQEIETRFRNIINDPAVTISPTPGQEMPATEPSSLTSPLFLAMEKIFRAEHPNALVVPYMSRGATDGSYLRQKGMAVYGVPIFLREGGESRAHGNDERISAGNLGRGTELLWKIVNAAAGIGD
ncbi:MAG TPA: M20/M25/M40 family metallo-hydrolase [Bryobacteraceae bacterium]|nr:M20/M25/M40 family metallo-hydrolase [Bryobacteraceae bacterium]